MTEVSRRGLVASTLAAGLAPMPAVAAGRAIAFVVAGKDAIANSAPAVWAADQLRDVLVARGASVRTVRTPGEAVPGELRLIVAGGDAVAARDAIARLGAVLPPGPEAPAVLGGTLDERETMLAVDRDARGLVYALTEWSDRVVTTPGSDATLAPGDGVARLSRRACGPTASRGGRIARLWRPAPRRPEIRFEPGRAVPLAVGANGLVGARLHYRRLNQAEA